MNYDEVVIRIWERNGMIAVEIWLDEQAVYFNVGRLASMTAWPWEMTGRLFGSDDPESVINAVLPGGRWLREREHGDLPDRAARFRGKLKFWLDRDSVKELAYLRLQYDGDRLDFSLTPKLFYNNMSQAAMRVLFGIL